MNFGGLIDRVYDILGDFRPRPRMYTLARTRELLNEGFRQFRLRVQDRWIETHESLVASQAIYNLPANTVRVERIAFEDRTISSATIIEIISENHRWQKAEPVARPRAWTTEDVDHNQYRIYPPAANASAIATTIAPEAGILANSVDLTGANVTFDQDHGVVVQIVTEGLSPDAGLLGKITSTGAAQLTLWLVEGTPDLVGDEEEIPIPEAYYIAPVYWAVAESYSELGDHHEPGLRRYYEARFAAEVKMAVDAFAMYMGQMLVGVGSDLAVGSSGDITLPTEVSNEGTTRSVIWARHCMQDDGDGFYEF